MTKYSLFLTGLFLIFNNVYSDAPREDIPNQEQFTVTEENVDEVKTRLNEIYRNTSQDHDFYWSGRERQRERHVRMQCKILRDFLHLPQGECSDVFLAAVTEQLKVF